jgi:hypothetical protein
MVTGTRGNSYDSHILPFPIDAKWEHGLVSRVAEMASEIADAREWVPLSSATSVAFPRSVRLIRAPISPPSWGSNSAVDPEFHKLLY